MSELTAVKARQREMWGLADYASVAARILLVSELLCESVGVRGGEQVLDVACGTGNAALAASRRFAQSVGVDYQPRLLAQARDRAAAEGLPVRFEEGDAEDLPFHDHAFDVVLSACGAMFAPDQPRVAEELVRVCRPGGRIGMVNWTPDSWVAEVGRAVGRYVAPPPEVAPPVRWGDHDHLDALLGGAATIEAPRKRFLFRFPSAEQHVAFFCDNYPPIVAALGQLTGDEQARLRADLLDMAHRFDVADGPEGLVLGLDYLEVVATVKG